MRIHHIALRTRDVRKVAHFYRRAIGLPELRRSRAAGRLRSVWLDADGALFMIERAERGEPEIARGSRELVAFAVTEAEHRRLRSRLERLGVPVEAETSFTSYFRDPDGRRVGISHFKTAQKPKIRRARRKAM